jgi:hypothetical protein
MKAIRNTAAGALQRANQVVNTGLDPDSLKWHGADSGKHYETFAKGAVPAYMQVLKEWKESGRGWEVPTNYPTGHGVADVLREMDRAKSSNTNYVAPQGVVPAGASANPQTLPLIAQEGQRLLAESVQMGHPITMPGADFTEKLQASLDRIAQDSFGKPLASLDNESQQRLLQQADTALKQSDPELYLQKRLVDYTAGQRYKGGSMYSPLAKATTTTNRLLRYGGIAAAVAGAGLGVYALYRLLTKPRKQEKTAEAKLAEEKRIAWGQLALLALLAGGTGLAAHHLLANRNQTKPATPPAPEAKPAAPVASPAPKPAEPVATPKPVVPAAPKPAGPLDGFRSYWSSMPEWRRARAFQKLQDEFPEPDKFSELGWMQKQKLKLLAGQSEKDQYGPTYAGLAKFVLDNPNREMLRGAFDIARADPGRDY